MVKGPKCNLLTDVNQLSFKTMENFNRDTRKQLVIVVLFPQPWTGALLCRMTELHLEKLLPPSGISSLRLPRDNDLCGIDLKKKKKKRGLKA